LSFGAEVLAAAFTSGGDLVAGGRGPGGVDGAAPDAKGPWVARYDAGGRLVWRTMLGADSRGWVRAVARSAADDVYAVGQSEAGPFVARLLQDGTVVWLTPLPMVSTVDFPSGQGSNRYIGVVSVATDPRGGAYVGATTAWSDAWLARVDAVGAILWSRTIPRDEPHDLNWGFAVAAYPDGGAVLVGARGGVLLPVSMSPGARAYAARFSEGGDALWTTDLPVGAPGWSRAASVDPDGGVLVAGSVQEFAPDPSGTPMPDGPRDAFVVQVDRDGNVQ
jgi:hypothetical protein